jgi:hypothetical protein
MKRYLKPSIIGLAIVLAMLVGIIVGDKRSLTEQWLDLFRRKASTTAATAKFDPNDPALKAGLPTADPEVIFPLCPLNALLKPDLTPQEQTGIIGQMLIDYWTTTRTLPHGEWSEICEQLAGKNHEKLDLVPVGHPALGKDSFISGKDQPGIRLHIIGASNCLFQLIHNGPDGQPYTDDDMIRNFPPDVETR